MRKAAAAGIILAGAILVAGGLDKESGSENFVADVQGKEGTAQKEGETKLETGLEGENAPAGHDGQVFHLKQGGRTTHVSESVAG